MQAEAWPVWPTRVVKSLEQELGEQVHERLALCFLRTVGTETHAVRLRVLKDLRTLQTHAEDGQPRWWLLGSGCSDHSEPHERSREVMVQLSLVK